MLFNHFNIYCLNCLRVPRAHATSAFTDLKVNVYGMKGKRLWDEKVNVYGMKGKRLWDER